MIRSMTGFGAAERSTAAGLLVAEIRTVNHRFLSLNLRLPRALEPFESQVREALRGHVQRGHVNVALRVDAADAEARTGPRLVLDEQRARDYRGILEELRERLELPGEVGLDLVARFPDLVVPADEGSAGIGGEDVRAVTEAAARETVRMREEEGRGLSRDLEGRLSAIEVALAEIRERAPARLASERDRLRRAVAELAGDVQVDEARLAQEIAYLAERWDVSEELVRLESHIALFRETVAKPAAEPVGKRLGFLVQEMHREANTTGSKANDAHIAHLVILMKDEIERLREQVDNIE